MRRLLVLVLTHKTLVLLVFVSVTALPCLLWGGPLVGAQVKLEMQCAHDYVGSVGRGGWFTGLEVVQPICPYSGSTGMPILLRVVNSQSQ